MSAIAIGTICMFRGIKHPEWCVMFNGRACVVTAHNLADVQGCTHHVRLADDSEAWAQPSVLIPLAPPGDPDRIESRALDEAFA